MGGNSEPFTRTGVSPPPGLVVARHDAGQGAAQLGSIYAEVAITIRRPRSDVAMVMFNPRCDTAWIGGLRKSVAGPGALRVGATVAREWYLLRNRIVDVSTVVQHTPGRVLEVATQLPFALRIRYELEGIPEGAIARIRLDGNASGALRWFAPLLNPVLRQVLIRDLERLKILLEAGAWRRMFV